MDSVDVTTGAEPSSRALERPCTAGWELGVITHGNSSESSLFVKGMRRSCALWLGIREKPYLTGPDVSAFCSDTKER
ncbi:hypothetical protein MTO96_038802 [Rhipicephalus appendiculatus]